MKNDSMDPNNVEMKGHSYDGITELDNPLPGWWLWTFFLTIIFAFLYFIHYQSGSGPTLKQELEVAMQELSKSGSQHQHGHTVVESDDQLAALLSDKSALPIGEEIYKSKCTACHGNELQGVIGPNLVDNYWIHGKGKPSAVLKVVREGILDKGMPEWQTILKREDVIAVTAFILSKKGATVNHPKAPQGDLAE